jgi:hypothetical protein
MTRVNVSTVVENQLPAHFIEADSELPALLKVYYEWMENTGGVLDSSNNLNENFYLDTADTGFLKFFTKRIIPNIPQTTYADKKQVIRHARNFYQTKGTEEAFKFLFWAVFGKKISFYYPKQDLFRTSSAQWQSINTVKVTSTDVNFSSIIGRKIYGVTTGATAIVDSFVPSIYGSTNYYTLNVISPIGSFNVGETILTETVSGAATITSTTIGLVSSWKINNGGTGYQVGDNITTTNGDGYDFSSYVAEVDVNGTITKLGINNTGVLFTSVAPLLSSIPHGTGASITFYVGAMNSTHSYPDDQNFLSSTKKLQDGEVYQEFSYFLNTDAPAGDFDALVKNLLHPAGTKRFYVFDTSLSQIIPANAGIVSGTLFLTTSNGGGGSTTTSIISTASVYNDVQTFSTLDVSSLAPKTVITYVSGTTGPTGDTINLFATELISVYASTRVIDMMKTGSAGSSNAEAQTFVTIS